VNDHAAVAQALSAGRYGAFVWPAYGATALGFAWMIIDTLVRARRWRRKAERLDKGGEP
jgi:heme exporter protein D